MASTRTALWGRRINRRVYWLWLVLLIVAEVIARGILNLPVMMVGLASQIALVFLSRARLHDLGASGWWAMLIWAIQSILLGGALVLVPALRPLNAGAPTDTAINQIYALEPLLGLAVIGLQLVWLVWLGIRKGAAGDNAYGPPMGRRAEPKLSLVL